MRKTSLEIEGLMLRNLLRAGPRGWWELAEAQLWLVWAAVLVAIRPRGQLVIAGEAPAPHTSNRISELGAVERIGTAIARAGRYGLTRPHCLVRSIALQRMLSRHGITEAQVRFGVRRGPGAFESHAWVEWNGRVIADDPGHVRTFTPLDDLRLSKGRES
ncbi:MAG: lasso peptide biosynthesis B2 protein [Gemmatimonadota bacterium]